MGFNTSFGTGEDPLKVVRLNKEGQAVAIPMRVVSRMDERIAGIAQTFVGLGSGDELTIIRHGEVLPIEEEKALAEWERLPVIGILGQFPGPDSPGNGTGA